MTTLRESLDADYEDRRDRDPDRDFDLDRAIFRGIVRQKIRAGDHLKGPWIARLMRQTAPDPRRTDGAHT